MKINIYTTLFGDYDFLSEPKNFDDRINFYVFTNNDSLNCIKWKKIIVNDVKYTNSQLSRKYKISPFNYFNEDQILIYLDSNIKILETIDPLIDTFIKSNADIGFFKHYHSKNIYDEVSSLLLNGNKVDPILLADEIYNYDLDFNLENFSENGVFFRKINSENINKQKDFSRLWFNLFLAGSGRDQISLPVVRSKNILNEFFFKSFRDMKYFHISKHKNKSLYLHKIEDYFSKNMNKSLFHKLLHYYTQKI